MRYSDLKHLTPKFDDTWPQVVAIVRHVMLTGGNTDACNKLPIVIIFLTLLLSMMQHDYLTNDDQSSFSLIMCKI